MEKLTTTQFVGMIILIILSFIVGIQFEGYRSITRAQELYHQDKLQYSSSDINYVATGQKQIKK